MRYPVGQVPNPEYPYSESMHQMLSLSMGMSILIGIALLVLARRGNILWMTVWSIGLIVLGAAYLIADAINLF